VRDAQLRAAVVGAVDHQYHAPAPRVRMGASHVGNRYPEIDRKAFLRDRLSVEWRRCGGRPGAATIELETTRAEIVSVDEPRLEGEDTPLLRQCLQNAAWDLILPVAFHQDAEVFSVQL
jgi:hypothetical protein